MMQQQMKPFSTNEIRNSHFEWNKEPIKIHHTQRNDGIANGGTTNKQNKKLIVEN